MVGTTLAPLVKVATRYRISPWVTAAVLGLVIVAGLATAVTFLAKPSRMGRQGTGDRHYRKAEALRS